MSGLPDGGVGSALVVFGATRQSGGPKVDTAQLQPEAHRLVSEKSPQSVTSRVAPRIWPRCGAKTRAGTPCKASGEGLGARCRNHGGLAASASLAEPHSRTGKRVLRRFVVFSALEGSVGDWLASTPRERRAWAVSVLPVDLFHRLEQRGVMPCGADAAFISVELERAGVPRATARKWPQRIGFRTLLGLVARDRIAFAVVSGLDLRRASRTRAGPRSNGARRVEASELLAALRSAGQRLPQSSSAQLERQAGNGRAA